MFFSRLFWSIFQNWVTYTIQRGSSQSGLLCTLPGWWGSVPFPLLARIHWHATAAKWVRLITGSWQRWRHWGQGRRAVKWANSCSSIGPLCLYCIVCGQSRQPNTIIDADSTSAQPDKLCWVIRHGNDARNDTALRPLTCSKPLRDRGLPLCYNCENIVIQQ